MDLSNQDDTPFTLGIQTPCQFEMMEFFGDQNSISIYATFETYQSRVSLPFPLNEV
jgi:hypothetical protein